MSKLIQSLILILVCLFPSELNDGPTTQTNEKPQIVISQVYGGGGNSGAIFQNDFIELFNRGNSGVSLEGWSVQYASATRTNWQKVDLSGSMEAGSYFLVRLSGSGGNGLPLPTPDAVGSINLSAGAGKVALVLNGSLLGADCPSGSDVIDFVGYGNNASCFEGAGPAPPPNSATAVVRTERGCNDSDDNSNDFVTGAPEPRNSLSLSLTCTSASIGPGEGFPASAEAGGQKPGSILVFPYYSSKSVSSVSENSRISITNIDPNRPVTIHLFFVQGNSKSVLEGFLCLSENQTMVFLASDLDPDVRGFLIAVAINPVTGCPVNFNFLIGDSYIKLDTGHVANPQAFSISALTSIPAGCDLTGNAAQLEFDGIHYNRLPSMLVADNISSVEDGNSSLLVIDRIDNDSDPGDKGIGHLIGLLFDDHENAYSIEADYDRAQFAGTISDSLPVALTGISDIIPSGRSGWLKLWSAEEAGIIGMVINYNRGEGGIGGAFNQGRNLHLIGLSDRARLTIPVFRPGC